MYIALLCCEVRMSSLCHLPYLDVVRVVEGEPVVHASRKRDHVSLAHLYPHPTLVLRAHVEVPAPYESNQQAASSGFKGWGGYA